MWRRLIGRTIWAKDAQPEGEKDFHLVAQMDLVVYDLIVIGFALLGTAYTIPAIGLVWGGSTVHIVSGMMLGSGVVALLALIFRLQVLEFFAKFVLTGMLLTYPSALLVLAFGDVGQRHALALLMYSLLIIPASRMRYLVVKWLRRRDERVAAAEMVKRLTGEIPIQKDTPA